MQLEVPTTLADFSRVFPDEAACVAYLYRVRWPDRFACPKCGDCRAYAIAGRGVVECRHGHQTSVTAGTILHRTKQPLLTWFYGAFLVSTLTPGISAVQFQRQLGIGRYETAFQMLHKLRAGLVDPEREPLSGEVEVDEAYVGGVEEGRPGRGAETKVPILVGVEVLSYEDMGKDRKTMVTKIRAGRIRISPIDDLSAASLVPWVQRNVAVGSRVLTDGNPSYNALGTIGYTHETVFASHKRVSTGQYLPLVHLIIVNLKTWLRGTHKGAVMPKHLPAYLNEFVFRFNRRFWRGPAFLRLLGLVTHTASRPEYETLYATGREGGWVHPNPRPRDVVDVQE